MAQNDNGTPATTYDRTTPISLGPILIRSVARGTEIRHCVESADGKLHVTIETFIEVLWSALEDQARDHETDWQKSTQPAQ